MKNFIFSVSILFLLTAFADSRQDKKSDSDLEILNRKPNVLFILTDDQRYSTIHALGNDIIKTPNLDKLVQGGVSFRNAYIMGGSSPAVCSPSRASLFSGLTLWNLENQGIYGFEISEKYKTLPQVFRENGYETFATGKNEPGREGHFARSFSAGDKILFRGMTGSQYRLPLSPFSPEGNYSVEKEVIHEGKHSAEIYADACIRFLEDQAEKDIPFFAYIAFQTPHDPRQAPERFREMYADDDMELPASFLPQHAFDNGMLNIRDENLAGFPRSSGEVKKHLADYFAMISHDDHQIGRILEALHKSGKLDNTIIIFTSDNGLAVGNHGLMGKQNIYEHSVRVPLVISGPGIPKGEIRGQLCYIYDIYPTLCERAGLPIPETVQFKSLNKVLTGRKEVHSKTLYFAFMSWQRAIRDERFKLIEYCVNGNRYTQLFDLKNDPEEIINLAGSQKYTRQLYKMRTMLESEKVKQNDGTTTFGFTRKQGEEFWKTYFSVEKTEFPKFQFPLEKEK
ncbi:sulfatase-like hydrolase/transferase [Mariniphaga sediminis]|uniref:sulfatase-like hydrolase/transferase n=1 Tax=Mariniphaga sediminis TaxID=1628158 RepID=UPI00356AEF01